MDKRIKIFTNDEPLELSFLVNSFLEQTEGKLHEVKCAIAQSTIDSCCIDSTVAICLIYTPETKEDK